MKDKKKTLKDIIKPGKLTITENEISIDGLTDGEVLELLLRSLSTQAMEIPKRHKCDAKSECIITDMCNSIQMAVVVIQAKAEMLRIQKGKNANA